MPVIVAASVAVNGLNSHRRGGLPPDKDDSIPKIFGFVLILCVSVFSFIFLLNVFSTETSTIVNAKVVHAWIEPAKKSNGYASTVHMRLDVNGHVWEPNETVRFTSCPEVVYNTLKPIYIKTRVDWFNSYSWASGITTFCKK